MKKIYETVMEGLHAFTIVSIAMLGFMVAVIAALAPFVLAGFAIAYGLKLGGF